jgi:hypothetical protein
MKLDLSAGLDVKIIVIDTMSGRGV